MADADFWKNLGKEFLKLDEWGYFVRVDYIVKSGEPDHWQVLGSTGTIQVLFEALARRAGLAVEPNRAMDPLFVWLDRLRSRYKQWLTIENREGTSEQRMNIPSVCVASSHYCVELENEALKSGSIPLPQPKPTVAAGAPALDTRSREERLQAFILANNASIAAVSRAAGVYKAQMQQWRHGILPEKSQMSQRIEAVLSSKTLLEAQGKSRPLTPRRPR